MKNTRINFIASVEEDRLNGIQEIAKNLEDMGCTIRQVLKVSGIISGSTKVGMALQEVKIEGIKHVEPDQQLRVND